MRAILCITLIAAACAHYQDLQNPKGVVTDVGQITEGMIFGFFKQMFPIQECISDTQTAIEDFEKAYFYFNKGKSSKPPNPKDIAEALQYVGDALKKIPAAIGECKDVLFILQRIEQLMKTFSNPVSFVTKVGSAILFHGKEITTDIVYACVYWEQHDMFHFGEMIGRVAVITLAKDKDAVVETPVNIDQIQSSELVSQ